MITQEKHYDIAKSPRTMSDNYGYRLHHSKRWRWGFDTRRAAARAAEARYRHIHNQPRSAT